MDFVVPERVQFCERDGKSAFSLGHGFASVTYSSWFIPLAFLSRADGVLGLQ